MSAAILLALVVLAWHAARGHIRVPWQRRGHATFVATYARSVMVIGCVAFALGMHVYWFAVFVCVAVAMWGVGYHADPLRHIWGRR